MHRTNPLQHPPALMAGLVLALGAATACAPGAEREAFASERVYQPIGSEIRWGATTAERFRLDRSEFMGARQAEPAGLHWTTPPGWSELPTTQLRMANFRVAGDARAECYLTTLSGEGGGLDANVNRWRTQMSQPPLSSQEIAALPRLDWFGRPSVLVEIDGTWGGMSGDQNGADYRMVGLLQVSPTGSKFLKMIGPRALVAGETEHFKALAASFHDGAHGAEGEGAHDHAAEAGPGDGARTMPKDAVHGMPDDAVHGAVDDGMAAGLDAPAAGASAFRWTAPAGWTQGPEKAMREVTFLAGEKREVECYVTALGGDGGGLAANLNRWRQQLGRDPLSDAELAALPRIPMLGTEASLIEITREGDGGDMVLGAVCLNPTRSVFVKLLGPKPAVEDQRAAFLEFCKSIQGR